MTILEVAHAQAGIDLLTANASLTVHVGKLPAAATEVAPPFVLVRPVVEFLARGEDRSGSLDGQAATCLTTWYCHCVGLTAVAAVAVAGQVRTALLNQRPTVAGRHVNLIEQVSADPVGPDEALGPALFEVRAIYEMETRPG